MSDFLKDIMAGVTNEYAQCADEGIAAGDVDEYIDTGSYLLNGMLSGSIHKGLPKNKITAFAGPEGTGKSFLCLSTVKQFLEKSPDGGAIIFETESALSKKLLQDFGIDTKRVWIVPVETVQEFRNQAVTILDNYLKKSKEDQKPLMFVLDSLGMLSTSKEVEDIAAGKDTRDMTRSQLIRGAFRVLTLKLGKARIPLLVTNHTYQTMDLFSKTEMSGGGGIRYSCSNVLILSKRSDKDASGQIGNVIHCKLVKGRLTREGSQVDVLIRFDSGLNRWFGLIDIAIACGLFKKSGAWIETPQGKVYASKIMENPTKFFTPDVLEAVDDYISKKFCYGSSIPLTDTEEDTNAE